MPTKKQYAFEATKKTIEILQGAASLVGVPLVKEVLHIGLAMIKTCEASNQSIAVLVANWLVDMQAVNEVQEKVAELKNRVAEFLLVIAKVVKDPESPLAKLSGDVIEELEGLKR